MSTAWISLPLFCPGTPMPGASLPTPPYLKARPAVRPLPMAAPDTQDRTIRHDFGFRVTRSARAAAGARRSTVVPFPHAPSEDVA